MSRLLRLRLNLNLTQEELSEKSGVSVRTIQRIEAGNTPKGYTLRTLAKALAVNETDLLEDSEITSSNNHKWLKIINLSSLPLSFVPPLNVVVPLLIMFIKKEFTPATRQIVSIQLLWTFLAILLFMIPVMLNDWFEIRSKFTMLIPVVWILVNSIIILRNAFEISKSKNPRIIPDFNIL